jgi:hypothetical protein
MDLLCAYLFNFTTTGGDTTLCVDDFGSTTQYLPLDHSSPLDYSEESVETLILPSPSKIGVDGYAASSFVTTDLETSPFPTLTPSAQTFRQSMSHYRSMLVLTNIKHFLTTRFGMVF